MRELFGRIRDKRRVVTLGIFECVMGGDGEKDGVRVDEEQPLGRSRPCAKPKSVIFANPTRREFCRSNDLQTRDFGGELREDLGSTVGGLVIDDDELSDFGLGGKTTHRGLDVVFFVARGNDG